MEAKSLRIILIAVLAIGLACIAPISPAAEKAIELKVANYFSPTHHQSKLINAWAKRVEHETNGRIRFTIYPGGSLLKGPETWTGTVQGVADIGVGWIKGFGKEGMSPYHYGPVAMAATYGAKDGMMASQIGDEIGRIFPPYAEELSDLKVLASYSLANLMFYSKKVAIRHLDDLRGRTVRSGNKAVSALIKHVGGSPLFMSMGEVYTGLQKGTVDIMAGYPSTLGGGYKHAEVVKYVTQTRIPGGAPLIGFVGMNWSAWNKLPPDLKKVIVGSAVRLEYESRQLRVDEVAQGIEFAKSKGCEIIELAPEDREKIRGILKEIAREEAKKMDGKGLKGTDFLEAAYKASARFIN